ncbi:hypothetical protein HFK84_15250 [Ralstonia pseudosolanacearum]|uniref:HAD domain-containing protein n=1 Tax=Ralstonia pseudosolanacearum TaxID=1310165 RepID=UPI0020059E41|nr:HAD domain-containing protein [Ralstonia pseudosolanacearum]MCK4143626.1 hypothetical protein [Ralstonia pseudosolanacearum]
MHPILFLGYDGCLHPDGVHHVNGEPELRVEGHRLFEHALQLARLLEPYPDLRIVLSTAWARIYGLERAKGFLPAALQNRVVGMTHEFCGDMAEWAGLTEFDHVMRYVEGRGIRAWLALSCDKYYWPEAFEKNRVWLYKGYGLGEDRAIKELAEKLERMHGDVPRQGAVRLGGAGCLDAERKHWDMAMTKLADARISALSASTRFQAAYDALRFGACVLLKSQPQAVALHMGRLLEQLPVELGVESDDQDSSIALLQAWQGYDYWDPRPVKSSDVDVVLNFVEAVLSAVQSRLQAT